MTLKSANVVVIGGGVNGASVAMHLARMGAGRVLLVDKGPLAGGATGRSGAMIREHYLHPALVRMAKESSEVFHNFGDAVGGDARFLQTGRLLLFDERDAASARANVAMNRDLGVDIKTLSPDEITEIVPRMNAQDVALAAYEPNSGYADSIATTYAYADQARKYGAEILTGCAVTGFKLAGGRVTGVETEAGTVEAEAVVAVAGPWTNRLAATLGETLSITPLRVQMVHLRRPPSLESLTTIVIDYTNGSYYRANSGFHTLMGGEREEDLQEITDPDNYGLNSDHDAIMRFWERAKKRFPDFASTTPLGGYGSLYDMTPDGNPILGKSAVAEGLYWAAGFSGHGFKLSPAVGRMMAELVMLGDSRDHPVGAFRPSRFAEGDPLEAEHPYVGALHP